MNILGLMLSPLLSFHACLQLLTIEVSYYKSLNIYLYAQLKHKVGTMLLSSVEIMNLLVDVTLL